MTAKKSKRIEKPPTKARSEPVAAPETVARHESKKKIPIMDPVFGGCCSEKCPRCNQGSSIVQHGREHNCGICGAEWVA